MSKAIATLLLAAVSAAALSTGPLELTTNRYSLTLAEGWISNPVFPPTDSFAIAMQVEAEASAIFICNVAQGPVDPDSILSNLDLAPEGLEELSRETRQIGSHSFVTAVYRSTEPDGQNADLRYRVYMTSGNGLFFMSFLSLPDGGAGAGIITGFESALGALVLKGGASIRPFVRGRSAPGLAASRTGWRDALGRSPVVSVRRVPSPVFVRE